MLDCILYLFDKYQTFVAGIIGFAGVIITILMNAKLARDQHKRELRHEADAVRSALITELKLLCNSYELRIEQLGDMRGRSALINEYVANQAYLQLLQKIGLLTREEIERTMTAHQLNNELPFRLALVTGDTEYAGQQGYVKVKEDQAELVSNIHSEFLKVIKSAVETLENNITKE